MKKQKIDIGDLVEIEWLDATAEMGMDKNAGSFKNVPVKELLTQTKTVGYVMKQDRYGYVIATNINALDDVDYVAIPRTWGEEVNLLTYARRKR